MKLLALYWSFMIIGYLLAWHLARREIRFSWVQTAMMGTIYVLCLIMGLRMGINEQVTSNLGSIGIMSLIVTVICIAGSMFAIFLLRKLFRMDRYGNLKGKGEDTADASAKEENSIDLKSTFIILALVAVGMVLGALVLAGRYKSFLPEFDEMSSTGLVVLLCILLFFVGFDLGASGTVFNSLKTVGFRVIAFPFAAVIGTLIAGSVCCMIMGFSLKEALAICLGFGWYTYAPVVIAGAGKQYMIASAVSFMHNVIRETAGIVFIPILAKKTGYLEVTGVPGVAAMDVCMPIVERSCRPDTVVYSFATGLLMCLVTSIGVPLVMGL